MKVWTLIEDTNIKNAETGNDRLRKVINCRTFGTFEAARDAMRELIRSYATGNNDLFDGDGRFCDLYNDLMQGIETFEGLEADELERETGAQADLVRGFCLGEDIEKPLIEHFGKFANCKQIAFECNSDWVEFTDHPFKGKIPEPLAEHYEEACDLLMTNAIIMKDPTIKYYCWAHNEFDRHYDYETPSYFHIELVMTEVE